MPYLGKKPTDFADVTESQSFTVTEDLTVDTDTLYVDSADNRVAIGHTAPDRHLHIKDSSNGELKIEGTSNGGYIQLTSSATSNYIGMPAAISSGSASDLMFYVDGAERWRILANGNLKAATDGIGIDFSASENANASSSVLDDYEEGTWTPTNPEVTLTVTHSRYTKIGRFLYISFDLTFPSNSNAGLARIEGLPYNIASYSGGFTHWTTYSAHINFHGTGSTLYAQNPANPDATLQNQNVSGIRMIANAVLQI